jgi:hypothetical protein
MESAKNSNGILFGTFSKSVHMNDRKGYERTGFGEYKNRLNMGSG